MSDLKPITRQEMFLAKAAGQDVPTLGPITREEYFLKDLIDAISAIAEPTQEMISIAVNAYLDEHGIGDNLFIASEDIEEVLEG